MGLFANNIEVKLLTSIPGIGVESAVTLLIEIEDIYRFCFKQKTGLFFGVNPEYKQKRRWPMGNPVSEQEKAEEPYEQFLYMACMTGIRKNEPIKKQVCSSQSTGPGAL